MIRRIVIAGVIGFIASTAAPTFGFSDAPRHRIECRDKSGVSLSRVRYNPPANARHGINSERVIITNQGRHARNLNGWSLRDGAGHAYRFPRTSLQPGRSVIVHTGHGKQHPHNRYWGRNHPVWNDTHDQAKLRNRAGSPVDSCKWRHGGRSTRC